MAFKQYTSCIEPHEYITTNHLLVATGQASLVAGSAFAAIATTGAWHCWWIAAEIFAIAWVVAYCRLFLYERLICLGGDRDAIGAVISVSGTTLRGLPDNDFSVNLLLQNNEFGADRATVIESTPFGFLVDEQPKIANAGLPTSGHSSEDKHGTQKFSEDLHAEFEGGGAYYLYLGATVALFAAFAALAVCLIPFPGAQIIALALALLALLAILVGGIVGLLSGGSASDANPNLGEVQTNNESNNGAGAGADILFVSGSWVYDPWHTGWNEIHPVKVCMRVGKWDGDWDTPPDIILRVRTQLDVAATDATIAAQQRPENQWAVHPALDSCAAVIIT